VKLKHESELPILLPNFVNNWSSGFYKSWFSP